MALTAADARVRARDRVCMLITPYLDGFNIDPETEQVLGVALEMTRVRLGLADDFANGIIAKQVIELAKAGERNPTCLCEGAIEKLREHRSEERRVGKECRSRRWTDD